MAIIVENSLYPDKHEKKNDIISYSGYKKKMITTRNKDWYQKILHVIQFSIRGGMEVTTAITLLNCLWNKKLKKPTSTALSLGTFVGLFRFVHQISKNSINESNLKIYPNDKKAAAVAAMFAFFFYDRKQRTMLITYSFVQAIRTLWIHLRENGYISKVSNIDIIVLCLSSCRVVSTWLLNPQYLEKSHVRVLDYYSTLSSTTLSNARKTFKNPFNTTTYCQVIHPNTTHCTSFHLQYTFPNLIRRSASVYAPLYTIGLLNQFIFQSKTREIATVFKSMKGWMYSICFLSSYYQIALLVACYSPWYRSSGPLLSKLGGGIGALSVLLESKSRRTSISGMVSTYALISLGRELAIKWNLPRRGENRGRTIFDVLIFTLSIATLFHRPDLQNKTFIQYIYGYVLPSISSSSSNSHKKEDEPQQTIPRIETSDKQLCKNMLEFDHLRASYELNDDIFLDDSDFIKE